MVQQAPHRCIRRFSARTVAVAAKYGDLTGLGDSLVNEPGLPISRLTDYFDYGSPIR